MLDVIRKSIPKSPRFQINFVLMNFIETSGQPVLCMECRGYRELIILDIPLHIDCRPSPHWLLTLSILTVDPLYSDCQSVPPQDQQRQSPFHAKVKVECWSSLHWLSICCPPGSTEVITFSCKSESSVLILSASIINPPRINRDDRLSMRKWKLTVDPLCIDRQSPPRSRQKLLLQNDHASGTVPATLYSLIYWLCIIGVV